MGDHTVKLPAIKKLLFLCILSSSVLLRAQELTIYSIPAPHPLQWHSPGQLVFSYLRNSLSPSVYRNNKHPIGHMLVHLKDSTHDMIAGVSAVRHAGMTRKVLFNGYGLGILFEKIKGQLDETAKNLPDILQRAERGDIAFIRFRISQVAFDRLWTYYEAYKEKGLYKIYNGQNHPFTGEGAGCSAFAFSFLEVAGLQEMIPDAICKFDRAIPSSLIREPGSQVKVSLFRLLLSRKWAADKDPQANHYHTYEPTWLYNWIKVKQPFIPLTGKVQQCWFQKAPGIQIDCRDLPVPTGRLWKF
jgi:hypothetical protein